MHSLSVSENEQISAHGRTSSKSFWNQFWGSIIDHNEWDVCDLLSSPPCKWLMRFHDMRSFLPPTIPIREKIKEGCVDYFHRSNAVSEKIIGKVEGIFFLSFFFREIIFVDFLVDFERKNKIWTTSLREDDLECGLL